MEQLPHANARAAQNQLRDPQEAEGLKAHEFGPRDFRNALGRFATGITVVTMHSGPHTFGITVNAFMSVSLDPPLVAVSIDKRARAHATLQSAERFGISVLAAGQEQLSDLFAGRPVDGPAEPFERFADFPVVRGALSQLVCRLHQSHDAGDHTIFVGEVEALRTNGSAPLLFYKGAYHELPEPVLAD